jgi:hypothetical protein
MAETPAARLPQTLAALLLRKDPEGIRAKNECLNQLVSCGRFSPAGIRDYQQCLLFLRAYPDSPAQYRLAGQELKRVGEWVAHAIRRSERWARAFAGTGFPASMHIGSFSLAMNRWLLEAYPASARLHSSGAGNETSAACLRALLPRAEYEKITRGKGGLLPRIRALKPRGYPALQWLLEQLERSGLSPTLQDGLFQELDTYVQWEFDPDAIHACSLYWEESKPVCNRNWKKVVNLKQAVKKSIPAPAPLSPEKRNRLTGLARACLAMLHRETDPFTYADPEQLEYVSLDRGIDMALYYMKAERRYSLESYVGYLAFKNGHPVAYGGGWLWGTRCQFGINLLPAFRGGESAFVLSQLLRLYLQRFGATCFVITPYQFGQDNPEALKTGAFWFYYKQGFRPEEKVLAELAAAEWAKIQAGNGYRSPLTVLKKLATGPLRLDLQPGIEHPPDAAELSALITGFINRQFQGNRQQAVRFCQAKTCRLLSLSKKMFKTEAEKDCLTNWSLLAAAALDLRNWNRSALDQLAAFIRTKGGGAEEEAIRLLRKLQPFWKDIMAATGNTGAG